ncbi:nucleotidyltransferase domain-containing protein [Caenispirillum salinarum]|uniref:nucleotidyltransferase domain-containing protein n=1 Tax=Caenispirillum salinarum TaxID=859058 RepID=UPI00384FE181
MTEELKRTEQEAAEALDRVLASVETTRLAHALRAAAGIDVDFWLFGSRARGDHRPDSDWDVMAVVPDEADLEAVDARLQVAAVKMAARMAADLTVITVSCRAFSWPLVDLHPGSVTYACRTEGRPLQCCRRIDLPVLRRRQTFLCSPWSGAWHRLAGAGNGRGTRASVIELRFVAHAVCVEGYPAPKR